MPADAALAAAPVTPQAAERIVGREITCNIK